MLDMGKKETNKKGNIPMVQAKDWADYNPAILGCSKKNPDHINVIIPSTHYFY